MVYTFLPNNVFQSGVNLIKFLQVSFTSIAIASEVENNSYTCKLYLKIVQLFKERSFQMPTPIESNAPVSKLKNTCGKYLLSGHLY